MEKQRLAYDELFFLEQETPIETSSLIQTRGRRRRIYNMTTHRDKLQILQEIAELIKGTSIYNKYYQVEIDSRSFIDNLEKNKTIILIFTEIPESIKIYKEIIIRVFLDYNKSNNIDDYRTSKNYKALVKQWVRKLDVREKKRVSKTPNPINTDRNFRNFVLFALNCFKSSSFDDLKKLFDLYHNKYSLNFNKIICSRTWWAKYINDPINMEIKRVWTLLRSTKEKHTNLDSESIYEKWTQKLNDLSVKKEMPEGTSFLIERHSSFAQDGDPKSDINKIDNEIGTSWINETSWMNKISWMNETHETSGRMEGNDSIFDCIFDCN